MRPWTPWGVPLYWNGSEGVRETHGHEGMGLWPITRMPSGHAHPAAPPQPVSSSRRAPVSGVRFPALPVCVPCLSRETGQGHAQRDSNLGAEPDVCERPITYPHHIVVRQEDTPSPVAGNRQPSEIGRVGHQARRGPP
jgi:hypothetical protein